MKSRNPVLGSETFDDLEPTSEKMTLSGTVNRTAMLLAITLIGSLWTWKVAGSDESMVLPYLLVGSIGGLIVGFITIFKPRLSAFTAPAYALLEGLAIGGVSALFEASFPGIVIQAVGLTFGTLACLLLAYKSGLIEVTEKFKLGVIAATGAICVLYIVDLILRMFGTNISFIHEGGVVGIGFSLFVVTIAALNLVLDFDFIDKGVASGSPKYMEWYGGFALLVTLVWLYLEILRLLAKLRE